MLSVQTISVHYKVQNGLNDQSALFFDNNFKSLVNSQVFFPTGLSTVNNIDTVPEIIKCKQLFYGLFWFCSIEDWFQSTFRTHTNIPIG